MIPQLFLEPDSNLYGTQEPAKSLRARVSTTGRDAIAAGTPLGKPGKV